MSAAGKEGESEGNEALTNEFICWPTISSIKWADSGFCFDPSPKPCLRTHTHTRGHTAVGKPWGSERRAERRRNKRATEGEKRERVVRTNGCRTCTHVSSLPLLPTLSLSFIPSYAHSQRLFGNDFFVFFLKKPARDGLMPSRAGAAASQRAIPIQATHIICMISAT